MPLTAAVIVAAAFLFGCILTAVARRLAPRLGFVDRPDDKRKQHARAMPLMGGVAIFAAFSLSALILVAVVPLPSDGLAEGRVDVFPLLASAGLFCLLGLYDDRRALTPRWKLLGQVLACLPFVLWGEAIGRIGALGVQCTLGAWSVPLTIFWLVACSNVINLMDGMDGLAGTIGCIALATLGAMAVLMGRYEVVVFAIVAAACVAGFLTHNWPPAKIFMGDSGSLMLGFLIGALAIQASLKQAAGFMLIVPLVLISVPVFDTVMAILRRKLSGRRIGEADRGHIHHRLQDQGLSRERSLLLIAGLCSAMSVFCVLSLLVGSDLLALTLCGSLLAVLVVARVFGHYEVDLALQHLYAIGHLLADTSRGLPSRMLAVRVKNMVPEQSDDCWRLACGQLAQCGGASLEICFANGKRNVLHRLCWKAEASELTAGGTATGDTWQVRHTVRRERGILVIFTAQGVMNEPQGAAQWNEATQLLHALCSTWPLDAIPPDTSDTSGGLDAHVIPFDDSLGQQPRAA